MSNTHQSIYQARNHGNYPTLDYTKRDYHVHVHAMRSKCARIIIMPKEWRKIMQPLFFFAIANLAKEIFIYMNIIGDILRVVIESYGDHYLGLYSKLARNS
jgi:hypothetical protein